MIESVGVRICLALWLGLVVPIRSMAAFDSGSTGADGPFNPKVSTELQLPPSGVFNFTTVTIPTGVVVTFRKNATNTPVVMLASGNVTIAGSIVISGGHAANVGAAGDGNIGDDGLPGIGGPGGFDGGAGGLPRAAGGAGLGPGGGGGGRIETYSGVAYAEGGGGGGYKDNGGGSNDDTAPRSGNPGLAYGTDVLLPLIGGSGGGGGSGGDSFSGSGGGGGGGAILIASSGTVQIDGSILAEGGTSGASSGSGCGARGGYGSGGAIRIVAQVIAGNGAVHAGARNSVSGLPRYSEGPNCETGSARLRWGGYGGIGRVRMEAETYTRTAASVPSQSFGKPGPVFIAGFPTLRIASVGGIDAPAEPTGKADVVLPTNLPNPVTVRFVTTGVPVGNTIKLTVTPQSGISASAVSPAITGTTDSGSASVNIDIPAGPSVLSASTTYTVLADAGAALAPLAGGEQVRKVTLIAGVGEPGRALLTTVSGRTVEVSQASLAGAGG